MIVSFHPIIVADQNRICAGRPPDENDLAAIRRARAVILPQGCPEALYRMARQNCARVFPNLDARFDFPGKLGQIRLFRQLGVAHPQTEIYDDLARYRRASSRLTPPVVLKLNWGGQGDTVFRIDAAAQLREALERVRAFEKSGQPGFLLQRFIAHEQRALRVTAIGSNLISYWRIQTRADHFGTSVTGGARIDHAADPELQTAARRVTADICARAGIELAGFDFIFDQHALARGKIEPLALEINYFFGRTGLGGSQAYYELLTGAVDRWLQGLGLARNPAQ